MPRDPNGTDRSDILASARGLGVARDGRWLVRNVDMDVRRGEIVTLIGPNGSGKTTTAKALLGLIRPSAGAVTRAEGITVGYVPQRLSLDWDGRDDGGHRLASGVYFARARFGDRSETRKLVLLR